MLNPETIAKYKEKPSAGKEQKSSPKDSGKTQSPPPAILKK